MQTTPHVLMADDEDLVAFALTGMLEDHGFRVTAVNNGLQALEADERDPADILVTDMRMPLLDGQGLIRLVRQRRPELPIVVMTGYSEGIPPEEQGRLIVLAKPFMTDRLVQAVKTLLTWAPHRQEPARARSSA